MKNMILESQNKREQIRLTSKASAAGWAAKISPDRLLEVLRHLPKFEDENLLAGIINSEDAAVYKIDDEKSIVATLDFFTPIVDDPYTFGQIAATNALSDIYAMGAKPLVCMNIVCFPNDMDIDILKQIMLGGADKVKESGALLVGGHSIQDKEPKYGLSVVGIIDNKRVLKNTGIRDGDILFMTKKLGTGLISTGIKRGIVSKESVDALNYSMTRLNKYASEAIYDFDIGGCTDITGFGLVGHLSEMLSEGKHTAEIDYNKLNCYEEAKKLAEEKISFGGLKNNTEYYSCKVYNENLTDEELSLIFDPQTAGGLLFSVKEDDVKMVEEALKAANEDYSIIGKIVPRKEKRIHVRK